MALLAAIGCATGSYLTLTGYEVAAMHFVGQRLPYRQTALTAFLAYAIAHSVGVAALSGGSVRYRLYSLRGLGATVIAQVVAFVTLTFALGASLLLGIALLLMPATDSAILRLPLSVVTLAGAVFVALPAIYLVVIGSRREPIDIGNWKVTLPTPLTGVAQIGLSAADLMLAAGTLYWLLAPELQFGFLPFLGIYLLALAAGLLSNIPGGIGVFEAMLIVALPEVDRSVLLAAIILYRLIYYIVPLGIAIVLLIGLELEKTRHVFGAAADKALHVLAPIVPLLLGAAVFLAGAILLTSGSMPAVDARLTFIVKGIPLPVLELSHLVGSVLGVILLVLAIGLFRRLHTACIIAMALLVGGAVMSLLKGFDYEEAIALTAIFAALWISRHEFYRHGLTVEQRFAPGWVVSVVAVFLIAFWFGIITHKNVAYSDQLWWQFALHGDAPRSLRAALAAAVTLFAFMLWKLLRTGHESQPGEPVAEELELVRHLIRLSSDSLSNVALLGDKRLLWSPAKDAFLMYQICGRSWVALGGPVGALAAHEDLVWSFREMVDRHDGKLVFYEVLDDALPMYVEMGLTLAKVGEDARVRLDDFSLQGSRRADLRQASNRMKREQCTFEIVARSAVPEIIVELRSVSDAWLDNKAVAEKGFSMGAFSESYLCNFDCAIVRKNSAIVAFSNIWTAEAAGELSIDLMRFNDQAPKGVMEYLFTEIMLWAKNNDFAWFSLGVAPLSGLDQRAMAPLWNKLGHLIFSHGGSFYNFEGLRHYKEKFDPVWRTRYIACEGGLLSLPRALIDSTRLISGGVVAIVQK